MLTIEDSEGKELFIIKDEDKEPTQVKEVVKKPEEEQVEGEQK